MTEKKKLLIHGGSSLISKFLIKNFYSTFDEIHIFCRNIKKTELILNFQNSGSQKLFFYENDLDDLNKTLADIDKLPNDLSGVLWISGYTGDPILEFENLDKAKKNLEVNFVNVTISISKLVNKIIKNNDSFICVITSVAGLRGRKKLIYYSSSKSGLIAFLSALRQKLFEDKILVTTIIPGYMNTKPFRDTKLNAPSLLVTNPKVVASILKRSIDKRKEIVYINNFWRLIMLAIKIIPERIFKRFSF